MMQSAGMIGFWRSDTPSTVPPQIISALIAPGLLTGSIAMGVATLGFGFMIGMQGLFAKSPAAPPSPQEPSALPPAILAPGVSFIAPSGDEIAVEEALAVAEPVESPPEIASPLKVRPMGLAEPRVGGADNLRAIAGIGPKIEAGLNELGIWHFDQIAGWGPAEIAWIDDHLRFPGRIARDKWVEQAKALSA